MYSYPETGNKVTGKGGNGVFPGKGGRATYSQNINDDGTKINDLYWGSPKLENHGGGGGGASNNNGDTQTLSNGKHNWEGGIASCIITLGEDIEPF